MPASTIVTGMVLSAMPVGDFDKRLVILTKELGKITAFAKGARRPQSALLACSQPFSFGEFQLYAGRNSYNVMSVEITNYFAELREDISSLYHGIYFCEFADYMTKENNDEKDILKLLYQTLRALVKKTIDIELIKLIFELKIVSLGGEAPQVFHCVKCGQSFSQYYFSEVNGGVLCYEDLKYDRSAKKLSTSTLYTLQYIISKDIEKLYSFKVSDEVYRELQYCINRYLKCYIDHEFKALELIQTMETKFF